MGQLIARDVFTEKRQARVARRQVRLKVGSIFVREDEPLPWLEQITHVLAGFVLTAVAVLLIKQFGLAWW